MRELPSMLSHADLRGTFVALLTPVRQDGGIDSGALERLIAHAAAGGVTGICPVGSTGEGPRLTRRERLLVTRIARSGAGGLPVIAAPAGLSLADVVDEIPELAEEGADAVLVAPPPYYPMVPTEIAEFYTAVADASTGPVVLYNIPAMTKVVIPSAVVAQLARHPRIIGIKDSSRDLEYLREVVRATASEDFAVLTGTDAMLIASLGLGATGAITSSGNLVPEVGREVYDAYHASDLRRAVDAQRQLFDIVQACRIGTFPSGWKAAVALTGLIEPVMVAPGSALLAAEVAEIARRLRDLGVLDTSDTSTNVEGGSR